MVDLKAQYQSIKREINDAISRVLESSQFVLGEAVASFEADFARYCQAKYAVAVNSGTSALHLAVLAAGIGAGDEVITTPFTFVASVAAIQYAGAQPVLVDIDPSTFNLDAAKIEDAITPRTRAIMPVHLYGQMAEMDAIMEIARRHKLVVIEDAAQAHGAEYKGRRAGSIGALNCFSFYPVKNLGAYGEGGALITNSEEYARKLRMLRDWGTDKKYHHLIKGYNYRMEGLQGAILGVKLRHLENWNESRRVHAKQYRDLLKDSELQLPVELSGVRHIYHAFTVRCRDRDALQSALAASGVQTAIHYPVPVHLQPAYSDLGYKSGDFPHAERAAKEVLSLPIFPEMTPPQLSEVADAIYAASATRTIPSGQTD